MKHQTKGNTVLAVFYFLAILSVLTFTLIAPYFEMRAFNKFSKEKATYLDAVFSELRIEAKQ